MLRPTPARLLLAAVLFLPLAGCSRFSKTSAKPGEPPPKLSIFYTCDTRGHMDPCGCSSGMAGGMARRKALFLTEQLPSHPWILVDAGDVTAGSREWELLELEYLLKAYGQMGYHAVNAGHREAYIRADKLRAIRAGYDKLISANLVDASGNTVFPPSTMATLPDGRSVGILGVMDDRIATSDLGEGLRILPPRDAIARHLPELKKKVSFIILLAFADEDRLKEIADEFYEINVIIGGKVRQPTSTPLRANKSLITCITDKGKSIGRLNLTANGTGGYADNNEIFQLGDNIKDDPGITALIEEYKSKLRQTDFQPVHKDDEEGLSLITSGKDRDTNRYTGPESCKNCHSTAYAIWEKSKHAQAFHTLEERGYQTNPRCLECHTVGYMSADGYINQKLTPQLKNVSCESCHGRGANHVKFHEGDKAITQPRMVKNVDCVTCHNPDNSAKFERTAYWRRIVHGKE